MKLRRRVSRHSADVVIGLLVAIVAGESITASIGMFPALLLAIKLNVFAIPIVFYPGIFAFELWV